MRTYTCPVCGYDKLEEPPSDYAICPSCGTEFGYTDAVRTHEELQKLWVVNGRRWHSRVTSQPENWDADKQLKNVVNPLYTYTNTNYADISIEIVTVVKSGKSATINVPSKSHVNNSFFAPKPSYALATIRE